MTNGIGASAEELARTREIAARSGVSGSPLQGQGGYFQCWYPMVKSDEVRPGEVVGRDYLGGRLVIYRAESGRPYVKSAYCRHMGADLSAGEVIGEDIRCAFHHWKYGPDGACCDIPSGDPIPKNANLYSFPTAESMGMIWAFNGAEPLYEVPNVPIADDLVEIYVDDPVEMPHDTSLMIANGFDMQHLKTLHQLEILNSPDDYVFDEYGIAYDLHAIDPKFGELKQAYRLFGVSAFYLGGTMPGPDGEIDVMNFLCGVPTKNFGSRSWMITACERQGSDQKGREKTQAMLQHALAFHKNLAVDDDPILRTMRFRDDNLTKSDGPIKRYFDYLRRYPRAHPSESFIT